MKYIPQALVLLLAASLPLLAQTNVLTQHNDIGRTGLNATETILTPANVSGGSFGKLYSVNLDGRAYAQPLYVSSVTIGGVKHSVLYVATEHDSVYALDANANGAVLWKASLFDASHGAAAGAIPDPKEDTGCGDIDGAEYGITGTPVIDSGSGTLYAVSTTLESGYPVQRLHALDITSGAEKFGGPVVIASSQAGSGANSNGVVSFDPKWENQRTGLLLLNGTVYLGWGSHCDAGPWHGWVMGYNATTLKQTFSFLSSPNGAEAGVWLSGAGLAADNDGPNGAPRIFTATGNGSFDSNGDWAESVLNLNLSGSGAQVADSFTPNTQNALTAGDIDLGSAGTLVLPDQPGAHPHLAVQLSKAGTMYLLNRDNLGGYNTTADQSLQELTFGSYQYGLWGIPAYFNGNIYFWPANSTMMQYSLSNGALSTSPTYVGTQTESGTGGGYYVGTFLGATPSISANGTSNGIVWVDDTVRDQGNPIQYLYAYNAANVSNTLWVSSQNAARDGAGGSQKFAVPTVADGKVFLPSDSQMQVYGLLPANYPQFTLSAFQPVLSVVPGSSAATQIGVSPIGSFSGAVTLSVSGLPSGVTAAFSQSNAAGWTTLTLTASSSAPLTTSAATVTINGVSGSMTQTTTMLVSVSTTPGPVAVNMAAADNVYGFFLNNVVPTNGGFDTEGYSYSANVLGTAATALGVPFYFAPPNVANAVSSTTVALPQGNFASLSFVGAAANGAQASQTFVVTYTDGTTATFTQSLSDWGYPQNYSGETIASSMTYRLTPSGSDVGPFYLYAYSLPINSAKIVNSITLPSNRNVAILAITLSGQAVSSNNVTIAPLTLSPGNGVVVGASISGQTSAPSNLGLGGVSCVNVSGCQYNLGGGNGSVGFEFVNVGSTSAQLVVFLPSTVKPSATPYAIPITLGSAQAGTFKLTVPLTAQTISFGAIASQTSGKSLALSATASSGLAVTFTSSTTSVCTVSGTTASLMSSGTCTITASQAGNGTYAAAASVSQSFSVSAASASVSIAPFSLAPGNGVVVGATISGLSAAPGNLGLGGVACVNVSGCQYNLGGSSGVVGFEFVNVSSTAAQLVIFLPSTVKPSSSPYAIPITLGSSAAGTLSLTVPGALTQQTITFNPIPAQTVGQSITVSATASSGLPVTFSLVPNGNCSINGNVVTLLNVGNCGVIANQAGNSTYAPAPAVGQIIVVN